METAKNNLQLIDTNSEVSNQEKAFLLHGTEKSRSMPKTPQNIRFHFAI
jgi:hypothetical protein